MQPRWKRVLNTINRQMGEALGQAYVDVTFSPEAKAQAQHLVHNLSEALKARIENLAWMSAETKAKALEKWASFRSEEHTSELQSLMRISYAVFCLKKKNTNKQKITHRQH